MQDILLKSIFVVCFLFNSCQSQQTSYNLDNYNTSQPTETVSDIIPGAERIANYMQFVDDATIGLVVNQTSIVEDKHLVDTLLQLDVNIVKIFSPEHGFRGTADAGEVLKDGIDPKTQLPIISLYGKKKKPSAEDLNGIEVMVFDIQDVGVRFYTYISTLTLVMEACAEQGIPVLVLDRPNPNGHYVDGPVLKEGFESFVGMHKIPVVYGMTTGECAMMINEEGWLSNGLKCQLTVMPCKNYDRIMTYELPVKPSPNLPNYRSVLLYPSLCFFEGTTVSVGRGTPYPFQHIGHPAISFSSYAFTPVSSPGAKYPKHENKTCLGKSFREIPLKELKEKARLDLSHLLEYYDILKKMEEPFFLENNFIDKLAGTDQLRKQILDGWTEEQIRQSWQEDLDAFKKIRSKYLLYPL